jgi:hypothetical protein
MRRLANRVAGSVDRLGASYCLTYYLPSARYDMTSVGLMQPNHAKETAVTSDGINAEPPKMSRRAPVAIIIMTWLLMEVCTGIIYPSILVAKAFEAGGGRLESLSSSLFIPIGNIFFICVGLLCARMSDIYIEFSDRLRGGGRRVGAAAVLLCALVAVVTFCS